MTTMEKALKEAISGEVHFDLIHRKVYSVDASIYEIEPIGIVLPKNKQDVLAAVKIAQQHHVPVIARGAATGITGGCLGKALIIDTSKYLNRILEINYEEEYAICEPGVVQDRLNDALSAKGYRLGPDTSTGNRATIGGMLANNAAGARSLIYGTMADHILAVELLLYTGELLNLHQLTPSEWQSKCSQQDIEGNIYRAVERIRKEYAQDIEKHFPKIPRRVSGYNLDRLINTDTPNLSQIIAGSEGTLGIATEMKVRIAKKPRIVGLAVLQLTDMFQGMSAIEAILTHHPIALEMIDHRIIEAARHSPSVRNKLDWLQDNPQALFIAEFEDSSLNKVTDKLSAFENDMRMQGIGSAYACFTDPIKMANVWDVRKSGLGLLLSRRSYSRAIAFLEDISVAPKQLASFMTKFCQYLNSKGKTAGIYGHVGSGCMHIRPYIDLRQSDDVHLMEHMMHDISDLLLEHGGALSGEHGDGLTRSWLNPKMFGKRLYQAFLDLKAAFDPNNLMNPGKVVNGPPFLQDLRLSPETKQVQIKTFLDFSREGGFELAADLCNGNGMCRKMEKTMCPSFQASHDEFHSTRARAEALRAIINGRMPKSEFTGQGMHDVLDLCLECKGCKTECPSEVDMAKMKAEFLYQYQKVHGSSIRSRMFANIGRLNQICSPIASMFNWINETKLAKTVLNWFGITPKRDLPRLSSERFSKWFENEFSQQEQRKQVVLFNDTFTEFNQPEIGKAAIFVLQKMGYEVIVPEWHCCGRPAISKGKLELARKMGQKVVANLKPFVDRGLPIIGLEPSCLLSIKDDYFGLLEKKDQFELEKLTALCTTFDEFVAQHIKDSRLPLEFKEIDFQEVKLHGHCHQKALVGMKPTISVLKAIPGFKVSEIPSGCCGLAGSFGYESEHYDFSMKIGELKLLPAVRESTEETLIVADGFSCRSQITHGTQKRAYHLAEVMADSLK